MFNPLPAIALMPLALLWFGLGVKSLVFVIIHSVLWPMSLNTYTGFVTVPSKFTETTVETVVLKDVDALVADLVKWIGGGQ